MVVVLVVMYDGGCSGGFSAQWLLTYGFMVHGKRCCSGMGIDLVVVVVHGCGVWWGRTGT